MCRSGWPRPPEERGKRSSSWRARHAFDVKRARRRHADEAEHPRRALCDPGSPTRDRPSITEGGPEYRDQLRDGSAPEARAVPDVELEDPGGFRYPVHPADLRLPRTDGGVGIPCNKR